MSHPTPCPFLVREATISDLPCIRAWLPEATEGTPAARVSLAIEPFTGAVAGIAMVRVFKDRVGRFHVLVSPAFRRRGCGTALLERVLWEARKALATSLLTVQSYDPEADDDATRTALAFLRARGLSVGQEVVRYRAEFAAVLPLLQPLYERFLPEPHPHAYRIVTADQVSPHALADFIVNQVGGLPEDVVARLHSRIYHLPTSMVALVDNVIVGAFLTIVPQGDKGIIETSAVAAEHRGGWLNLALMYHSVVAAVDLGVKSIDFETDLRGHNTARLARRLGATQVGRRQCWGCSLPASADEPPPQSRAPAVVELHGRYTTRFVDLLAQLSLSLAVTTPQTGKLILVRADGRQVNLHWRGFDAPRGLAVAGDRLAISTGLEIREFHNDPSVAAQLEPAGKHDACFLRRGAHTTGDLRIEDMAWAGDELWFVNTLFSCLCTRDVGHHFALRWKPPFVSALAPEDRCHLNGLAMVEGRPRFVTALAATDTPQGWRQHLGDSGVVLDVASGEVLCRGLSLPHSPRWHDGRLWLLEAGTSTLGVVDQRTGRYQPVAALPGLPRGLAFWDRYAFVGLSQAGALGFFRDLPLAQRVPPERVCGVWVVDVVTGNVVAWLELGGMQEVAAVERLPGRRFPEILNDNR
jgi:uncharacterized protein (TIGR03032 family)